MRNSRNWVMELGPTRQKRKMSSINCSQRLGLSKSGMKEVHEQVGIGMGHAGAKSGSLDLEVMLGVKGEVVASEFD